MTFFAGLLLVALQTAAPSTQHFRFERPVLGIPRGGSESCLPLDAELFAHAAPQLADLRLYRDGTETPYAIRQAAPVGAAAQTLSPLNLGTQGKDTVFDAAMPEGGYGDVELVIAEENFLATVTVTGSRTSERARATRLGGFTVFDLSRQKLGRSTVLHLPPSDFRFLHFRITGPVAPDKITGLSIAPLPAKEPLYRPVFQTTRFREENRWTVAEFTLPAQVPVDRVLFAVAPGARSFSREAMVSVQPSSPPRTTDQANYPPQRTFSGSLVRLHTIESGHQLDMEQLSVATPSVADADPAKWMVAIENGDDAPLPLVSVQIDMLERDLCFAADGRSRYTLLYGDAGLSAPRYDYAVLHAAPADPARTAAGPEQAHPGYRPRPDERPFTERHPALLWSSLVGVVLLLGAITVRSNRRATGAPS